MVIRSSSWLTNSSWEQRKPQEGKVDPTVGLFHWHPFPGEENPAEGCGGHREVSTGHKGVWPTDPSANSHCKRNRKIPPRRVLVL